MITPLASGRVKEPNKLNFGAIGYAQLENFIGRNFKSQSKIAEYIATNIFNITKNSTYSINADRSSINTCVRKALPDGDWINQLQWKSRRRLDVEADNIKFVNDGYLEQALEQLLEDPNTRFDKNKIRNVLANPHKYTCIL